MLKLFDYTESVKGMMERAFYCTLVGAVLIVMSIIVFILASQAVSISEEFIGLCFSVVSFILGLTIFLINGVRCAIYTNEYERQRYEMMLEEAENMEEPES